jgi:hypothetical protein
MVLIQFLREVNEEKILHNLRNIKKRYPYFRDYVSRITNLESLPEYILEDVEGKMIASCKFEIHDSSVCFFDFKGDKELKQMLHVDLVEDIGEKCFSTKGKSISLFFDLTDFYLCEKGEYYKLARDGNRLIKVERYHVPNELKNRQKSDCG